MEQILKLTKAQAKFYFRFASRYYEKKEIEYEEVPGVKEFQQKLKEAYKKAGMKIPVIE